MGYESPSAPLWHFHPRGHMTKNDLVKITYDNGSVLYVTKSGEKWMVDSMLLPDDLKAIRSRYSTTDFEVIRCTEGALQSGHVGSPLVVQAYGGEEYTQKVIKCTSLPVVMDISPAIRPARALDISPGFAPLVN
jgi:hypothetical protein